MSRNIASRALALLLWLGATLAGTWAGAAEPKEKTALLDHKEFSRPELVISSSHLPLEKAMASLPNQAAWARFRERAAAEGTIGARLHAFIDPRSGAVTNLVGAFPLIPGEGVGNTVTLESLGERLGVEAPGLTRGLVAQAARRFVVEHGDILGIAPEQLGDARAEPVRDDLWQIVVPQVFGGIPVRDGRVAGTIVKGNLVVIGTETWGHVRLGTRPAIGAEKAVELGFAYAEGRAPQDEILRQPGLEIVPVAPPEHQKGERFQGPLGKGYGHRLAWTFVFQRPPDDAAWEVVVDAHSGEVLALRDTNQYADRQITGGVYPLTSTGACPDAARCGAMQAGWPMPFTDTGFAAPMDFTNSAGVYNYTSGTAMTTLTGRYVDIVDACGPVNESGSGNINLGGSNNQHDCTSGGYSAGDTPASRSAFYEVNKIAELGRGWLPFNTWLQSRLTTNVNINNTCNGFWGGSSINFYRSGGGCRNTGEIAAVFDHEWGHGLDDNDAGGALSNSSEGYADIAAIYRLNASCVGYGFYHTLSKGCGQTADLTGYNQNEAQVGGAHCNTNCSGVRDADWAQHVGSVPDTAVGFVCNSCAGGTGPCGRQVHCAAAPVRQAAWDLVKRDLTAPPFNLDTQSALMVGNKLFYQGSGNIGLWYACTCGGSSNGCGATNGYMQWLAADDDNGNVGDGTPHMTAIHAAFNRHGIACGAPAPVNGGCGGGPTAAPTLSATAGNSSASLSWNAVAGAGKHWVLRTEGHAGCEFGKTLVAETTGTTYTDTQVANGRSYHYNVVGVGSASSACYGRASNCVTVTPVAPPPPPAPFTVSASVPGFITVKSTYPLNGSASHPATDWVWERSDDGSPFQFWTNVQNTQFVAYAGSYTIQWRLTARRLSDGATASDIATTTVCIPAGPGCLAAPQ